MKSQRERTPSIREWADCEEHERVSASGLLRPRRADLRVVATFSEDEDEGGQDGWSISNGTCHIAAQTPEGGDWGDEVTVSGVMLMRVNGHGPGGL